MNTFLPYSSYELSAKVLDYRRLGKQRIEVLQLLRALHGETTGWRNHPAAIMWRGHERSLAVYGMICCIEWVNRGYRDTTLPRIEAYYDRPRGSTQKPDWVSKPDVFNGFRSNLVRKDPAYYQPIWPNIPDDMPYVWSKPCTNPKHFHHEAAASV